MEQEIAFSPGSGAATKAASKSTGLCRDCVCQLGTVANLSACWDAGATQSSPGAGATWTDTVGNLAGTLLNGSAYDSGRGGSVVLDGTDDYISAPYAAAVNPATDSLTVSVWIYPSGTGTPTGNQRVVNNRGKGAWGNVAGWTLSIKKVSLQSKWYASGVGVSDDDGSSCRHVASSARSYDLDAWYMYTLVWNYQTDLLVYVHGADSQGRDGSALSGSGAAAIGTLLNDPTIPLEIGGTAYNNGSASTVDQVFCGSIASVQIYKAALTADEITDNWNATRHRFGT